MNSSFDQKSKAETHLQDEHDEQMMVSLTHFLRTGELGPVRVGLTPSEVVALLGQPDGVGATSRKNRHPQIYLYGTVELHFVHIPPFACWLIFWEARWQGPMSLGDRIVVGDWPLLLDTKRPKVEAYLSAQGLVWERSVTSPTPTLVLSSGVQLSFDEEDELGAISVLRTG